MNKRRVGKIEIPYRWYIESDEENTMLPQLFRFLSIIPYRAELMAYSDNMEIIGISHNFDEADEGVVVPDYYIEVHDEGYDSYKFNIIRK